MLETITIRNGFILNIEYNTFLKFEKLSEIIFDNYKFENADLIASLNLKSLSLINSDMQTYSFVNILKDLNQITIINGKVEMKKINLLDKLTYLQLSYFKIMDNDELDIDKIEELYIDNTYIKSFK